LYWPNFGPVFCAVCEYSQTGFRFVFFDLRCAMGLALIPVVVAGDTLNFRDSVAGRPADAGWALVHRLMPRAGGDDLVLTSESDSAAPAMHRTQVLASVTAGWAAGVYDWVSWVQKGVERFTLERGSLVIQLDSATGSLAGLDAVTPASVNSLEFALSMLVRYQEAEREALLANEVRLGVAGGGVDRVRIMDTLDRIRAGRQEWERRVGQLQNPSSSGGLGGMRVSVARFDL
jgi:hypothetical protein